MELRLVIWLLCGVWAAAIARRNGRSEVIAFGLGIVGGLITVLVYAVIGKKMVE